MSIINSLLKVFLGDKSGKDLKKLTPLVKEINSHFDTLSSLSNDELRNKTSEFKKIISEQTSEVNQSISDLNSKISTETSENIKEDLFKQVEVLEDDLLKIKANTLDDILPEAFAVIKETARRFYENKEIRVNASEFDKEIAVKKSYVNF